MRRIILTLLTLVAATTMMRAQKIALHLSDGRVAEYSTAQLDSICFITGESGGEEDYNVPSVTGDALDITNRTATLVGYATSIRDNLSTDLCVGIIYCTSGTPNKSNGQQVTVPKSSLSADGRYTAVLSGLTSEQTYYYRSFVYQSGLWFYGKVRSFTTAGIDATILTSDAAAITCFSAKVSGSVEVRSAYSSLISGICYATHTEPTTADMVQTCSGGIFTFQLRQLMGGTDYYYRTFAIVDGQTRYGTIRTFHTQDDNVVTTGAVDEETLSVTSRLTIGGGAYSRLAIGVCYGHQPLPTVSDQTASADELDEENGFSVTLVSPGYGTIYYRAYVLIDNVAHYGAVKSFEREEPPHEWVDLGLPSGTLWATCNVGATDPEEYGDYFAWGETEPKSTYDWSTYKYCNGSYDTMTKYCTSRSYGTVDNKTELEAEDDAATANWGSGWQMPSKEQQAELCNSNYTTTTWTTQNGKNGYQITSKSNGNSIFLPAAGYRYYSSFECVDFYGFFWLRSLETSASYGAYNLFFSWDGVNCGNNSRCCGQSVRPVRVSE